MTFGKRLSDLLISATAMIVLAPLFLIVALLVRRFLGTPVLFKQKRPGLHAKPFMLLKFRTMLDTADADGNPLPDEVRLTRFGKWLRATSLDELPSLWNIFVGDMSLVGPRPLLMQYLELYSPQQYRRHEVKPGLTGWAQVNGRNKLSFQDRFNLDVEYVDNLSLWFDLKIIFLTVKKVLSADGVTPDGKDIADYFTGNPPESD